MKNFMIIVLMFLSGSIIAQDSNTFFKALKNKDTNTIANFLSQDVDLCIASYQDFLTKSEALEKISKFLNDENPTSFELLHNGNSEKSKSNYNVAKLVCASGEYRVFVYYEKNKGTSKISELRFDK